METARTLQQWLNVAENVDVAARVLVEVSEKDQRRLKKISYQLQDSIWGTCSSKIFGKNDELHRMFLYTVWSQNQKDIMSVFNNMCGKKYIKPSEVVGDLFCICKKRYDKQDPKMVQCNGCLNWFHCICIGLDPNEVDLLPDYICEYCFELRKPPESNKIPEIEKHNFSFLQVSSSDVDVSSFCSPPVRTSTPIRCTSPALEEEEELILMEDQTFQEMQSLHTYCEKLKLLDSAFSEPHQLPVVLPKAVKDTNTGEEEDFRPKETTTKLQSNVSSDSKLLKMVSSEVKKVEPEADQSDDDDFVKTKPRGDPDGDKPEHKRTVKSKSRRYSTSSSESEEPKEYKSVPIDFKMTVPFEEWRKVCKVEYVTIALDGAVKLAGDEEEATCRRFTIKDKEYARPIIKEFSKINPYCHIRVTKKHVHEDHEVDKNRHQFRCYAKCTREGCSAQYSFVLHRIPITQRDVELTCRITSGKIRHKDKGEHAAYQLRGDDRKAAKQTLKTQSALKMRQGLLKEATEEGLKDGNLGFAYGLRVLRKAKSEGTHEEDRSPDPFVDLVCTKTALDEQIIGPKLNGYLQDIGFLPFKMLLYANVSYDVFYQTKKSHANITLVIDATDAPFDKFTKPVDTSKSLLYSVLLAEIPKDMSEFPILEFTSTRHTMADITSFFIYYFERYRRLYTDISPHYGVRRVEIDFSKTLLASSIYVFRRTSTAEYINYIWDKVMYGTFAEDSSEKPFIVHVCRFHVLRFLKLFFLKSYKKSDDQSFVLKTWTSWAQAFVVTSDMYSVTRRISDAFILSGTSYFTKEVAECLENILEPTSREDYKPWLFYDPTKQNSAAPFYKQSNFGQFSASISDCVTFYSSFLKSSKGATLSQEETAPNPFYSEDLVHYLKVHIFPYVPILTRMQFILFDLPITEDTTNRIERYHNTIKNVYHKGNYKQRAARFVEAQSTWVLGGAKLILAEICKKTASSSSKPSAMKVKPETEKEPAKPTLLDRFRQKESTTRKATSASSSKHQREPTASIKLPEDHEEKFKKRTSEIREKRIPSLIMTATFIKWGGKIRIKGNVVTLSNTCNFDTTLMVLNILSNFTTVGRNFINEMLEKDVLNGESLRQVLEDLKHGRVNSAKQIYCTKLLGKSLEDVESGVINMFGEESEHGFRPIQNWMRVLRRQRCTNELCPSSKCSAFNPPSWHFKLNELPIDTGRRTLVDTVRSTCKQMIDTLNMEISQEEWAAMETKCWNCREPCFTSYFFPGGPPDILFYPLNAIGANVFETDETVPAKQTVQGVEYNVFALTLYVSEQVHFVLRFHFDNLTFLYDGLQNSLKRMDSFTGHRVVGVWLMKAGLN